MAKVRNDDLHHCIVLADDLVIQRLFFIVNALIQAVFESPQEPPLLTHTTLEGDRLRRGGKRCLRDVAVQVAWRIDEAIAVGVVAMVETHLVLRTKEQNSD